MPVLNNNLVYHPSIRGASEAYQDQKALYDSSRLNVLKGGEIVLSDFISFNRGEGFGFLRVMSLEERPNPHDIVIYETLPNELSRVAGIITTVPQTPLSHVNLRAVQDGVPNAFIRDALDDADIDDLIGSYIRYEVTDDGYTIRAATPEEVDAHYAASRPSETQTPERDLSATQITDLDEIEFEDWNVFGVKAANVAVLRTLGFPDGIVPDGFAVPFYFYDEFMKHNGLYNEIEEMLADSDFQSDYDEQESELKKLRKKIKKGETPEWIITALTTMHATYPDGQSLRYRSSTNNEDLPGFSGAGLYDSKTQKPDETEEDGIDKSLKQVYASLWNFRAFTEREFHRIDHSAAAMGVLVHPNYSDELANGVAVSFNPIRNRYGSYYVNTQIGEDLVTNPEAHSVPEEILLYGVGAYRVLAYSNQAENGELLMSDSQLEQLRSHLEVIHDEFKELYDIEAGEPFAMEVEFKINSDNVLSIKQARPWVFGDGASPPNHPAAGLPTISGTAQAGQTLTAVTSDIDDADGLDNVSYSYQWLAGNTFIEDSTGSTYKVSEDDVGKTIEVRVSFTDDRNNAETLTSEATATVVVNTNSPATGLPTITGTAQVGQTLTADITAIADSDGLTNVSYSYQWLAGGSDIDGATGSTYDVSDDDVGKTIKVRVSFTDDAGNEETLTSAAPAEVAAKPNSPATGQPTISGTAQVGETLTASTLGVADADGLDNATFAYQWIAGGSDIDGATGSTYELSDADVGKTIKVRVSFTDDADNQETLTSAATAVVAAEGTVPGPPGHLRVFPHDAQGLDTSWEAPASNGGSSITGYTVQWKEVDDSWDTPADVSQETVSGTTHTISGLTDGVEYAVRVIASNEVGNGAPSAEETGTPRETTPPQIVMLRVDGATLRMSYDEDLDEESTPPADAFVVKVVPRHGDKHWQDEDARRMVESVQVTGDTVVLTLASAVTSEDYVVIRYNPPSDEASPRIRDAVGNAAAGFGSTEVFNDTEEAPAEQEGQHESGQNSTCHGRACHHRHRPGGRDADGGHGGHRRRRRPGQLHILLQVDGRRG